MGLLKDMYAGFLKPAKDFGTNSFRGYLVLNQSAQQNEKELLHSMSEEQTSLYKKIRNDHSDMANMELERMFLYAFRMGVAFAADLDLEQFRE